MITANIRIFIFTGLLSFCILNRSIIYGEIIYLNDGQVLKGTIVKENNKKIILKTKYQTRHVKRNNIKRILYGERDMERIYILYKNGSMTNGFLVDQNSKYIVFREKEDSIVEEKILKSDIKQISREEIIPLHPDISGRINIFYPLNSGGSGLAAAPMYTINIGFNFTRVKNVRIMPEAGYVKSISKANRNRYLQIVPLTIGISYKISLRNAVILPKTGIGIAVVDFRTGEGEEYRGYDLYSTVGAGTFYKLFDGALKLEVWIEYGLITESSALMHNIIAGAGISCPF